MGAEMGVSLTICWVQLVLESVSITVERIAGERVCGRNGVCNDNPNHKHPATLSIPETSHLLLER
jgi:hypothetical protein